MKIRLLMAFAFVYFFTGCANDGQKSIDSEPVLSAEELNKKCEFLEITNQPLTTNCVSWKIDRDTKDQARIRAYEEEVYQEKLEKQKQEKLKQEKEEIQLAKDAIQAEEKAGYKFITFEDFFLDSKKLKSKKFQLLDITQNMVID